MSRYQAGDYQASAKGFLDQVSVRVSVSPDRIESIEVGQRDSDGVGKLAIQHLSQQVIQEQSVEVDTVSGATSSSRGFLEATREAIRQAMGAPLPAEFTPGTYQAIADGYKGKISLKVTVDEESITEIDIQDIETPELGGRAKEKLMADIQADGSIRDLDVVSGATYTSKGIQEALDLALDYARGLKDPHAKPYSHELDTRIDFGTGRLTLDEVQAILDNLEVEISFVDADNRFLYYNKRRHQEHAGTPRSPVTLGGNVSDCHPPQIRDKVEKIMADLANGSRRSESMWYTKGNGYKIFLTYRPVYDKHGKYLGVLETVQNGQPFIDTDGSVWDRTLHDPAVPNPFIGEIPQDVEDWFEARYRAGLDPVKGQVRDIPYIESSQGGANADSVTQATKKKDQPETDSHSGASASHTQSVEASPNQDSVSGASESQHKMPEANIEVKADKPKPQIKGIEEVSDTASSASQKL
ncbi:FMN-binding protein [Hutsoniella sourekii]|uniref:FMN-binding protein n=1 Tax=Hutsoniella sourekii TaxID=87650 RepID=UPI0004B3520C|nr:FMN-binding protein [Hutsoniella sourekii]